MSISICLFHLWQHYYDGVKQQPNVHSNDYIYLPYLSKR